MSYRPDPGGIFDSDTHRRVLAHLPLPDDAATELEALGYRISDDGFHELKTVEDLSGVLADLVADGLASEKKSGYKQTAAGLEALCAPLPEEPTGPVKPALLEGLDVKVRSR